MNVLIIEDDANKLLQIQEALSEGYPSAKAHCARSYRSGLKLILEAEWDFVILDMSLPTYDIGFGEDGYLFRAFAGRDLLGEMSRKKRLYRTVLLTQFESFGSGTDTTTLAELSEGLKRDFPQAFIGSVFYNAAETNWRTELIRILHCD